MPYPKPKRLVLPIEPYKAGGSYWKFKDRARYKLFLRAIHLGDDVVVASGTRVVAVGKGQVVWSGVRAGNSRNHNWGGLVIVGHSSILAKRPFFSVYGHLSGIEVSVGDFVVAGEPLGAVAALGTEGSGGCKIPHLHFGIYAGPWKGRVLPGWWQLGRFRTRVRWWKDPRKFIEKYNN